MGPINLPSGGQILGCLGVIIVASIGFGALIVKGCSDDTITSKTPPKIDTTITIKNGKADTIYTYK